MKAEVVLTVSECKRLIAKGVAAIPYVQERLEKGIIVVNTGSTNAAVYEELTGTKIDKRAYLTGRTTPASHKGSWDIAALPDLVLVNGKPDPNLIVSQRWTKCALATCSSKAPTRSTMRHAWRASASAIRAAAPLAGRLALSMDASCAC